VALDLSASSVTGMTATPGEFDPDSTNSTGKDKIVSLVLPDAATIIIAGTYSDPSFKNFTKLKTVSGANIVTIGNNAFTSLTTLVTAAFPAAAIIGGQAFHSCTALATANFPLVTSIGNGAFGSCTALAGISLPASLTSIGDNPFQRCANLAAITVDSANTVYKHSGDKKMLLTKDETTLIAYPTASGAVTMPSITTLGAYAFAYTTITGVTLPDVTSIGNSAFCICTALATAEFPAATSIDREAFINTGTATLTLTLPQAAPTVVSGYVGSNTYSKSVIIKTPASLSGYDSTWETSFKTVFGMNATIDLTFEVLP
jgi:hypothetical protein